MVHGVGEQTGTFASGARSRLRAALSERGEGLVAAPVHWAPLADQHEHAFMKSVKRAGSRGNLSQSLTIGTLSDALAYQANDRLRAQIHFLMDYEYGQLRSPRPVIFAHSLGGLIALDWLRSRPQAKIGKLVTFGCNVGIFYLGKEFDCPNQVKLPGQWLNYWDENDLLGFPLAVRPEFMHVRDKEVSVGGWFTGWTGLAHLGYWNNRKLWSRTIPGDLR